MPRIHMIDRVIAETEALQGLPEEHLELIAGCASNRAYKRGQYLFREGEHADEFYVLRRGRVALELYVPGKGQVVVATMSPGEVVGWSWLFPPYRWHLDARAMDAVGAIAFDGACLRGKCDEDAKLGYEMMLRFASSMVQRLQETRVQLLDLYGE